MGLCEVRAKGDWGCGSPRSDITMAARQTPLKRFINLNRAGAYKVCLLER